MKASHSAPGLVLALFIVLAPPLYADWYLGNVHCHSARSHDVGGEHAQPASAVALLYRLQGFDFLCISDHDAVGGEAGAWITESSGFSVVENGKTVFLGITGSEVSVISPHMGAVGISSLLPKGLTMPEARLAAVRAQGGIAILNHPRWGDNLGRDDATTARVIYNLGDVRHMEIWNTDTVLPTVDPFTEQNEQSTWDLLLNMDAYILGVATDDEHFVGDLSDPETKMGMTGGVMVRADSLSRENILCAMRGGDFYSVARPTRGATWCTFDEMVLDTTGLFVSSPNAKSLTFVVGDELGVVRLVRVDSASSRGKAASYTLAGNERFVRAVAGNADGAWALSQPAFRLGTPARLLSARAGRTFDETGRGSVEVQWAPSNDPFALGQTLQRVLVPVAGEPAVQYVPLPRDATRYVDTAVHLGERWRYRIQTSLSGGRPSQVSNTVEPTLIRPVGTWIAFDTPADRERLRFVDARAATNEAPSDWEVSHGVLMQNSNIYAAEPALLGTYAIMKDVDAVDYDFSFDISMGDDDTVGCVWRFRDPEHCYALCWDRERKRFEALRFNGGAVPDTVAAREAGAPGYLTGVKYHVVLTCRGSAHSISVTGGDLASPIMLFFEDSTYKNGPPGVWTWASHYTNFDNLWAVPFPIPE